MRTDIAVDFDTGDLSLSERTPRYMVDFSWEKEDDYYLYGKCQFKSNFQNNDLEEGVGVYIPACLKYKKIKMSFWAIDGSNNAYPILNPIDNSEYYTVKDLNDKEVYASTLPVISDRFCYCFNLIDNQVYVSDMYSYDLSLCESLEQNESYLLKSYAGNLYQYPTTGIALQEYLNGNINDSSLGIKIKEEFNRDKMFVEEVNIDSETGQRAIKAREEI